MSSIQYKVLCCIIAEMKIIIYDYMQLSEI